MALRLLRRGPPAARPDRDDARTGRLPGRGARGVSRRATRARHVPALRAPHFLGPPLARLVALRGRDRERRRGLDERAVEAGWDDETPARERVGGGSRAC